MTAVVVVSFGRVALMRQTLDTLLASQYDPKLVTITVVDNHSQPEMIDLLVQYRDRIDNLVLLRENRGKPYAWNLGAKVAQEECIATDTKPPEFFLFCDNDLDFKVGWHAKMTASYREHCDLPLCSLSGMRWMPHPLKGLQEGKNEINIVRNPPGCCLMMSAKAFASNGPWDTKRLIRTVDTCMHRNSARRGWKNASVHPDTLIDHTGRKQRTWSIASGKPKLLD